jgi:hypothetical protein
MDMDFETWSKEFHEQLARFAEMEVGDVEAMTDESDLRRMFGDGRPPQDAAFDEYNDWCDSEQG